MDIQDSITYHITRTGNMLRQVSAKRIREAGLDITPEESVLLNQLWDRDKQSVSELGLWSVKEASTLTRQIDALVKKGYARRQDGVEDRRQVFVLLTAKGRRLKQRFDNTGIAKLDTEMTSATKKELDIALKVLLDIRDQAALALDRKS